MKCARLADVCDSPASHAFKRGPTPPLHSLSEFRVYDLRLIVWGLLCRVAGYLRKKQANALVSLRPRDRMGPAFRMGGLDRSSLIILIVFLERSNLVLTELTGVQNHTHHSGALPCGGTCCSVFTRACLTCDKLLQGHLADKTPPPP